MMPADERRRARLLALLPVVGGLVAYASSFGGAFVYDDFGTILQNEAIRTFPPRADPTPRG